MTATLAINERAIVHRTRGNTQGPITRLVSPSDLGEFLKPFVFVDHFSFAAVAEHPVFGMHPHSGIATLTYLIEGAVSYEDTTGKSGLLPTGGIEWMRAGNGVWHAGAPQLGTPVRGFQLWVALPPSEENAPAQSLYLSPSQVPQEAPARVLLGRYGAASSTIPAPASMNYLAVQIKNGERWRYTPPPGHTVAWVGVSTGQLDAGDRTGGPIRPGELAAFEESTGAIDFEAHGDASFVLGSAIKHSHELVLGNYSVHTSDVALAQGEAEIQRIGAGLAKRGIGRR